LSFIIYFKFYSIRLSRSYDLGCGFDKLTQFIFCLSFQFHHSTLSLLEIRFYNLFWFGLYRIIIVSHLGLQTSMLTQINSNWFNMLLFQYLYKKITLNIYFEPNYVFICRLDCFCTLKLTRSHRINLYIIFLKKLLKEILIYLKIYFFMLKEIFLQPDGQSSSRNKFAVTQKNLSRFQLGAKKSISYPPLTKSQTPPQYLTQHTRLNVRPIYNSPFHLTNYQSPCF